MGWFDGFPFKSRAQIEKERRAFEKKIFPFGEAQRAAAQRVVAEVLPGGKLADNEKFFSFICAKDQYLGDEEDQPNVGRAFRALREQKWLSDADKKSIVALVALDAALSSVADYPTPEQVQAAADSL